MTSRPARSRYALTSLLLDAALVALAFTFVPLDWERPHDRAIVGLTLAVGALLGVFLAGGYRLGFPLRVSLAAMTPLGLAIGIAGAWLLLKLVSSKAGLDDLNPPALEGFTPTALGLALIAFAHRAPRLSTLAARANRAPVLLVAPPAIAEALLPRWRDQGFAPPAMLILPDELAASRHRIATEDVHALVLAVPLTALALPELEQIAEARALGLPVMTAARFEEEHFGYTPLRTPDDPWLLLDEALERRTALYIGGKRLLDVVLALIVSAIAAVPFLLLALALRLGSRGPVFYRQTRAGLNREPFTLWKLRTMVTDAELNGPVFAGEDDPRVIPVGRFLRKTRIDELPQLWNVIRGDMSLVGPRPERPELDRELAPAIPFYALRHLTRPGITGWAQVRKGYTASPDDAFMKLEHDVYYLKHASFWFDLEILARTVPVVLGMRGR